MADAKISQLPAVTTPLALTEELPTVQSSTTKKVTVQQMLTGVIVTESGTLRNLSAGDNGKIIYCTNSSSVTINCTSGLGVGFNCTIIQGGSGKVTVAPNSQTLVSYSSLFSTMGQYAVISLITPAANTFVAAGNLGV